MHDSIPEEDRDAFIGVCMKALRQTFKSAVLDLKPAGHGPFWPGVLPPLFHRNTDKYINNMTVMTLLCSLAVKFYLLKGAMLKKNMHN